jgi:hypothetical protein
MLQREILRELDDLTDPYNYRDLGRGSQRIPADIGETAAT